MGWTGVCIYKLKKKLISKYINMNRKADRCLLIINEKQMTDQCLYLEIR